jgi:hypothetical protein
MSSTAAPTTFTYEQLMESFRESREEIAALRLAIKESQDNFNKRFERLGNRIGEIIESMVEGGFDRLFQAQGYMFTSCCRHKEFRIKEHDYCGEIDLLLENGDIACLVEVKTKLSVDDVKDHVEKLEMYRIDADSRGDKRRFIAAVGGGVVRENVQKFALSQGMYVVQQSGENVVIISPEGKPKIW